jgi:hypothetical protein
MHLHLTLKIISTNLLSYSCRLNYPVSQLNKICPQRVMSNRRHCPTEDKWYCPTEEKDYYPIEDKGYCSTEDKGYCPTEDKCYHKVSHSHQEPIPSITHLISRGY